MNRIILIGNGFDLAHELETSYKQIIDNFWKDEKNNFEAWRLRELKNAHDPYLKSYDNVFINISINVKWLNYAEPPIDGDGYNWFIKNKDKYIKFECKNTFLSHITEKTNLQNWVDIEKEYYLTLNMCSKDEDVIKLNDDFFKLKNILEKYIEAQTRKGILLSPQIKSHLQLGPLEHEQHNNLNVSLDSVLFLNFNYTKTDEPYHKYCTCNNIGVIRIHGELENPANPIIFGYGNEADDSYKAIKNKDNNDYLKNIKLFRYIETSNYSNLLNFINSDEYEVFIMGHSCGVSDRTVLGKIFDHDNCLSIKIFYYDKDTEDYTNKVKNISKAFTKKSIMDNIIVNKENCYPLLIKSGVENDHVQTL